MRRLEHRRVVGESEVVVGAQIDHLAAVGQATTGPCAEPMTRSRFSSPAASSASVSRRSRSRNSLPCMGLLCDFPGGSLGYYSGDDMIDEPDERGHRLDKWLWHARFYKTRSLATAAITGGKVHLNAERVKPAHRVRIGDRLSCRCRGSLPSSKSWACRSGAVRQPRRNRTISRRRRARSAAHSCANSNGWRRSRDRGRRRGRTSAIGAG